MARAFVSVGSNIDPADNVKKAVRLLGAQTRILATSTVYLTEPLGRSGQPPYYNCVLEIETGTPPLDLKLTVLRRIEDSLGRLRGSDKFAPRTIDLDLILYDDITIAGEVLTIPDPDILQRSFLAIALYELAPDLVLPGRRVFPEYSKHRRCHEHGILLLNAPHHHAEVPRLDHDADAVGIDRVLNGICDLFSQSFLYLEPPRVHVYEPCQLADAEDLAPRDVADMAAAEEGEHMVLAEAVDLNVPHDDHACGFLGEAGLIDQFLNIGSISRCEESERRGDPFRCVDEALAVRIFANFDQQFTDKLLNVFSVQSHNVSLPSTYRYKTQADSSFFAVSRQ